MKVNLLKQWKKEFIWISSNLNPNQVCDRNDIERLEEVFIQYFGEKYFEITTNQNRSLEKTNWIFNLLGQKDQSSLIALFEIGNLIKYLLTLDEEIQKKLRSSINSYKEFQNLLFEIYTYRLLDYNKIENEKKVWKGNQELEGTCKIGDKEFIYECRKAYTVDFERFDVINSISTQLFLEIQKMKSGQELIGYVRLKKNYKEAKKKIFKIIKQYFEQFGNKEKAFIRSEFNDEDCHFETLVYNESEYFQIINQKDRPEVVFKIIPPSTIIHGVKNHYRSEISPIFSILQEKITEKLIKTIRKKRRQHNPSKDANRIIFIDSEIAKNFRFPLLSLDSMLEEERIQSYIEQKETKDIVCIILRNYLGDTPSIKIKVFCKEEFNDVKNILEGLKTNFDYSVNRKK